MGYLSKDFEITSSLPPAKIFKAFILEADELYPKILPQAFKHAEIIEGDGGAGTVKIQEHHGGSVTKITTKFFTIGEVHLEEELINTGVEKLVGLFKVVEGYVLANPECV